MPAPHLSVVAAPIGPVTTATSAWRARGNLYLTVVVKATFALVSEGRMTIVEPESIAATEQLDPSGIGLRAAGDLAPYLGQAEVSLTGHATFPPRFSQPSLHVQLAVVQSGAVRVDKQLDLDLDAASLAAARARIAGMGPIARDWPLRSQWLEGLDPRGLAAPIPDLPEKLHWEYFQASPLDQRLDPLRGDEWIVLGGMIVSRPRLRTQLPAAWGAARLYRQAHDPPRTGEPIPLHADTLQIDVDRQRCSILYRGRVQLRDEAELAFVRVAGGLEQAGQPVAWVDPFPVEAAIPGVLSSTLGLLESDLLKIAGAAALPFVPPDAPAFDGSDMLDETLGISDDFAKKLAAALATPFDQASTKAADVAEFGAGVGVFRPDVGKLARSPALPFAKPTKPAAPITSPVDPLNHTLGLPDDFAQKLAAAGATPFEKARVPAPPAEDPLSGTMVFSSAIAAAIAKAPVTPFVASLGVPAIAIATAPSTPVVRRDEADPLSGTLALPTDLAAVLAAAPATPFEARDEVQVLPAAQALFLPTPSAPARPADDVMVRVAVALPAAMTRVARPLPPQAFDEEPLEIGGLGAEFLAAMELAESAS